MLTDAERMIVQSFAESVPTARRDAFLQSVAVALGQCTAPHNGDTVHKIASEELRRFLHPPKRQRALHQARRHA